MTYIVCYFGEIFPFKHIFFNNLFVQYIAGFTVMAAGPDQQENICFIFLCQVWMRNVKES